MNSKVAFVYLLVAGFVCSSIAANEPTARMLRKADEILRRTSVVSNQAVGFGGECPEANWALSVICASKEDPVAHLLELSEHCQPAGFVMCLLGVRALDEKRFAKEFTSRRKQIQEAKLAVETAVGCSFQKKPVLKVLEEKFWSRERLICDPIPELWDTIRVDPITDLFEEKTNQSAESNRDKAPVR